MNDLLHIYGNGSAGNHGCEALTRSLNKILAEIGEVRFYSLNCNEDIKYGLTESFKIIPLKSDINSKRLPYFLYRIRQHFAYSDINYFKMLYREFIENVMPGNVYLSAGGDNYSYGCNTWLECLNQGINRKGGRTILVGCSILENITDTGMIKDLSQYHTIIARESLTYSALKKAEVKSNILLSPDPAFALKTKFFPLPDGFVEGNTVGINLSPMVIEREVKPGILIENYVALIKFIIDNTDMQVALIPHVVWSHNDDRIPLRELYNCFRKTRRVLLVEDCDAEALKGYISRCRFMIASRTHASIAAYSSCVPTLVVGYSVKAKGIANDIFDSYDGYVIPTNNISDRNQLRNAFIDLMDKEDMIRQKYRRVMPSYINRVTDITKAVKSVMVENN